MGPASCYYQRLISMTLQRRKRFIPLKYVLQKSFSSIKVLNLKDLLIGSEKSKSANYYVQLYFIDKTTFIQP